MNTTDPSFSVVGLFAGIGGFELAFREAGFNPILLSEIDPAAQAVLGEKFSHIELVGDVNDVGALPTGTAVVTAGFPCQDLSMAGDKTGINGPKSGEVKKLFQILGQSRVPTVVIENVPFMLHLDRGQAMAWLVAQLESLGYRWAYRVLDTLGFGLPQRRRRVYLLATLEVDPRTILFADSGTSVKGETPSIDKPLGFYWTEGRSGVGITVDGIPPLKSGSSLGIPSPPAVLFPDGQVLLPSITACEALQGFPVSWTDAATAYGRNPRWRLLGNAVSVPVATWVASRIKQPGPVQEMQVRRLQSDARWPDAAFSIGNGRHAIEACPHPKYPEAGPNPSIEEFRDESWTSLSIRALRGFVGRAREGRLRFPEGFVEALEQNLASRRERDQ